MLDYTQSIVPSGYVCSVCGARGCKLWRQYQTFAEHIELLCCDCAGKDQERDVSSMNEEGMRLTPEYSWSRDQRSDQIGWLVPAVPTEVGDTYWGYTSVPEPGVQWWKRLPLRLTQKV